jgi:hypothetical protein
MYLRAHLRWISLKPLLTVSSTAFVGLGRSSFPITVESASVSVSAGLEVAIEGEESRVRYVGA